MNVVDLFSGIGGFSLGLEWAGMETVVFCEIDPYCRAVLRKHWPDVPIFEDVRDVTADRIPERIDLVCGGFPCQPVSQAGKRRGEKDDRWLWPEMLRVIAEVQPRWVIGENVAGLITMGLDDCLFDLEAEGYETGTFVIPACATGAPHRRDRIWIVAFSECGRHLHRQAQEQPADTWQQTQREPLSGSQDVAHTPPVHAQGHSDRQGQTQSGGSCRWPTEPNVGRVAHGIPRRVDRLRALGNAVVPQVVYEIGRAIMAVERENS